MTVYEYCAVAILCVAVLCVLRGLGSGLVPIAVAAGGIVLLSGAIGFLSGLTSLFDSLKTNVNISGYLSLMLKALSIAMLCKLTADICRDFGEASIASKVEFGGKAAILSLSVPLIKELISSASDLI